MIGYYKYTRQFIVEKIKKSQLTKDGFFYCPDFPKWNAAQGNYLERGYTFSRDCFSKKICFNTADIENYLETTRSYYNISESIAKDAYLFNILQEFGNMNIREFIDSYGNTLEDLIDTSIYIYNNSNK